MIEIKKVHRSFVITNDILYTVYRAFIDNDPSKISREQSRTVENSRKQSKTGGNSRINVCEFSQNDLISKVMLFLQPKKSKNPEFAVKLLFFMF